MGKVRDKAENGKGKKDRTYLLVPLVGVDYVCCFNGWKGKGKLGYASKDISRGRKLTRHAQIHSCSCHGFIEVHCKGVENGSKALNAKAFSLLIGHELVEMEVQGLFKEHVVVANGSADNGSHSKGFGMGGGVGSGWYGSKGVGGTRQRGQPFI